MATTARNIRSSLLEDIRRVALGRTYEEQQKQLTRDGQRSSNPGSFPRLCTAGQLWCEASVDVRLSVSESFRNVCEHICGWRRFILPSEESVGCETVMTSLTES